MKNYKQILEAINRGIQFALDDFDDEPINFPKKEAIKHNDNFLIQYYFNKIVNIPIENSIKVGDDETKRAIRKLYKKLKTLCHDNVKCIIYSREELVEFLRRIVPIDPKANLNWLDTSRLTNMFCLFDQFLSKDFCGNISEWDVSNVKNMYHMFYRCEKFNCDISNWNVSNVIKMDGMFAECYKFNQPIGKWDVHNVNNMAQMFAGCRNFKQDLSNWDVSNVKEMQWMFSRARKFDQDISMWDVSNVENNSGFYYDTELSKHPEKCPNFNIAKTMGNA